MRRLVEVIQLCAAQDSSCAFENAEFAGDRSGRRWVIARDHHRTNAGAPARRDGVPRLGARWVDHARETKQHQVALRARQRRIVLPRDGQHTQRIDGHRPRGMRYGDTIFVRERPFAGVVEPTRALRQDYLGCTLDVGHRTGPPGVQGNHSLGLGRERDLRDAGRFSLEL
jgi:hypothetical protein